MSEKKLREPREDQLGRETFISLFLAAGRLTDEVEAVCKEDGMTMAHYTVLWVVCLTEIENEGGVSMRTITDGLLTRASDVTRLVDRLVKGGHLERFPSEEDRRVVLVRTTASGRALFRKVTAGIKALHREQWSALSQDELKTLFGLLTKVLWGNDSSAARHPLESLPPILAAEPAD